MQDPNIPATLLGLIRYYRHEVGLALIAALVAAAVHFQRGDSGRQIFTESVLAGVLGGASNHVLKMAGVADTGAIGYVAAAMIGYLGAKTIFDLVASKLGLTRSKTDEQA